MTSALVGDVGGTHARFARWTAEGGLDGVRVVPAGEFDGLGGALRRYLELERLDAAAVGAAAVAVAGPVVGDEVVLTNVGWRFSIVATARELGLGRLVVLNDFEALALALPALGEGDLETIRSGTAVAGAPRALLGPGTGLGVAGLVPVGERWIALPGEGGHRDLAATTEREWRVVERLAARFGHASAERALSGPGLVWLHETIRELDGLAAEALSPAAVTERAASGADAACVEAALLFSGWLGAVAGDLALTLGARGGVYLGGGILERMGRAFDRQVCVRRFLDKGRFEAWLRPLPIRLVRHPAPALLGAARALADRV